MILKNREALFVKREAKDKLRERLPSGKEAVSRQEQAVTSPGTNVHEAPCQRPPNSIVSMRFLMLRNLRRGFRLGYKDNPAATSTN